jgi:hypothetical protein
MPAFRPFVRIAGGAADGIVLAHRYQFGGFTMHCVWDGFPVNCARPATGKSRQVTFWHRELPPLEADAMDEHTVEATSSRVPGTLAHRNELWDRCREDLMAQARARLEQEVARLGGDYAHVLREAIDSGRNDATGEAWLHGRFTYMLYRKPGRGSLSH